jgi:hypothetical protein
VAWVTGFSLKGLRISELWIKDCKPVLPNPTFSDTNTAHASNVTAEARLVTLVIRNKNNHGTASTGILFIRNCHKIPLTFYTDCYQGLATT